MDIHFISSLNPDDEDRLAPAILAALRPMLELMPIAYTVRIRTSSNNVYQHTRAELEPQRAAASDDPGQDPAFRVS
jgi:hypothetical protein